MDGDEEEADHEGRGLRFFAHFPSRRIASDPVDFPRNPTMGPGTHRSMSPISNFSFENLEPILVPNTTNSRRTLTPLLTLHSPPKWTGLRLGTLHLPTLTKKSRSLWKSMHAECQPELSLRIFQKENWLIGTTRVSARHSTSVS